MNRTVACEFFLIRYVPNVVTGEFVNIGVILRDIQHPETVAVRFTRSWSRARALHRELDSELLEALESDWSRNFASAVSDRRPFLDLIQGSLSNCIQITEPIACLSDTLPAELARLMQLYVDSARVPVRSRTSGREAIASAMRRTFERAGVWTMMRKGISASLYTAIGDPLRLDFGYRQNGTVRLFHAVSLRGDLDGAKVLALSSSRLREGVRRVEGAELTLTAIVESLRADKLNEEQAQSYTFGVTTMEEQGIRVATVTDLERIAETAVRELQI